MLKKNPLYEKCICGGRSKLENGDLKEKPIVSGLPIVYICESCGKVYNIRFYA